MTKGISNVIDLMPPDAVRAASAQIRIFSRGDQVELAGGLLDQLREHGEVVFDDGVLHQYSQQQGIFTAVQEADQSRILQRFAGAPAGEKGKPLKLGKGDVSGAMKLAWDQVTEPGYFAAAPSGVPFADAFVEVTAEGCSPKAHAVEHRARFAYPFPFEPKAYPARFAEFLSAAFLDDEDAADKVKLLQEYMGISLLGGATRYQRVLVVIGPGANGKGVFTTIAEAAMPPGSSCAIPPQDWGSEYRLAMLAGKRLNIVSELPEADILEAESFKAVVSGDSMTGRHIRQAPFTFRPVAGHIFAGNRLPGTNDQTHGFWRRMLVARFNRIFSVEEQDPRLAEHIIAAELPAIVSWFLEGAVRVLSQGTYTVPSSSEAAVEKWKKHADQVRGFVAERTEAVALTSPRTGWTKATTVYKAYKTWAEENGHRPMASNKFGARMEEIGRGSQHTEEGNMYPLRVERRFGEAG